MQTNLPCAYPRPKVVIICDGLDSYIDSNWQERSVDTNECRIHCPTLHLATRSSLRVNIIFFSHSCYLGFSRIKRLQPKKIGQSILATAKFSAFVVCRALAPRGLLDLYAARAITTEV